MNNTTNTKTIDYYKNVIHVQLPWVNDKKHKYADNIISLALQGAAEQYGPEVAAQIIDEFKLQQHGWFSVFCSPSSVTPSSPPTRPAQ